MCGAIALASLPDALLHVSKITYPQRHYGDLGGEISKMNFYYLDLKISYLKKKHALELNVWQMCCSYFIQRGFRFLSILC